jgi:sialic acid synthase SpsE
MKLIAETAWHHEGDFLFMKNLVSKISKKTQANIIKLHVTIDFDEYMDSSHAAYSQLKSMTFNKEQYMELVDIARKSNKEIMLLLNDTKAVAFGCSLNPEYVEIHSVCLNDIFLLKELKKKVQKETKIVLGVGGTSINEIENVINFLNHPNIILMFGFQNYPTVYGDVNLNKIRRMMKLFENFEFGYADHTAWNSKNNELITLLGAACGMKYIEKHVTTHHGKKRIDWQAAVSIKMFNELSEKIKILDELNGDGSLNMNGGEIKYSVFGPMKKAAILDSNLSKGDILRLEHIKFIRTNGVSDMSQLDVLNSIGKKIFKIPKKGTLIMRDYFKERE